MRETYVRWSEAWAGWCAAAAAGRAYVPEALRDGARPKPTVDSIVAALERATTAADERAGSPGYLPRPVRAKLVVDGTRYWVLRWTTTSDTLVELRAVPLEWDRWEVSIEGDGVRAEGEQYYRVRALREAVVADYRGLTA